METPSIRHIMPNFSRVTIGDHSFFFSYDVCVAVDDVCVENKWGPTTGKHLNIIEPNKDNRVTPEELQKYIAKLK